MSIYIFPGHFDILSIPITSSVFLLSSLVANTHLIFNLYLFFILFFCILTSGKGIVAVLPRYKQLRSAFNSLLSVCCILSISKPYMQKNESRVMYAASTNYEENQRWFLVNWIHLVNFDPNIFAVSICNIKNKFVLVLFESNIIPWVTCLMSSSVGCVSLVWTSHQPLV